MLMFNQALIEKTQQTTVIQHSAFKDKMQREIFISKPALKRRSKHLFCILRWKRKATLASESWPHKTLVSCTQTITGSRGLLLLNPKQNWIAVLTHAPWNATTKNKWARRTDSRLASQKLRTRGWADRQAGRREWQAKGAAEVSELRSGMRKSRRSTTWNSSSNKSSSGREMMRRSSLARMRVRKGTLAWGMEWVSCRKSAAVLGPSNLQAHKHTALVFRAREHPFHTFTHFSQQDAHTLPIKLELFKVYAVCGRQNVHIQGLETHCIFPQGLFRPAEPQNYSLEHFLSQTREVNSQVFCFVLFFAFFFCVRFVKPTANALKGTSSFRVNRDWMLRVIDSCGSNRKFTGLRPAN